MANNKSYRVLYLAELGSLLPRDAQREGAGRKLRSTPIPWLKFRTAADTTPAGQRYMMRRAAVKARANGFALLGIFDELLATYGGDRIAALRGYLVNHHLLPASTGELCQAIGCFERPLVEAALAALLREGLLVWRQTSYEAFTQAITADKTQAPLFDPPDDPDDHLFEDAADEAPAPAGEEAAADEGPHGPRRRCRARAVAANDRPAQGRRPAGKRARKPHKQRVKGVPAACRAAPGQPPGYARQETADVKRDTADGQTLPTPAAAAPSPSSAAGYGQTSDVKQAASAAPSPLTADPLRGDGDTPDGQTACPAGPPRQTGADSRQTACPAGPAPEMPAPAHETAGKPQPMEPTEADRAAAAMLFARGGGTWSTAHLLARSIFDAFYPDAQALAAGIAKTTPRQEPDEFERRELGCIAVAFAAARLAGATQQDLLQLEQRGLKEATTMKRRHTRKPPTAVWRICFNRHMEKQIGSGKWELCCRQARAALCSGPSPG
jgi:hypothetical protein